MSQRRSYPNSGDFNLDDLFRPEPGQPQGQPGQPQGPTAVPPVGQPSGQPEYLGDGAHTQQQWGAAPQPGYGVPPQADPAPATQHLPPYPAGDPQSGGYPAPQPGYGVPQQAAPGYQGYPPAAQPQTQQQPGHPGQGYGQGGYAQGAHGTDGYGQGGYAQGAHGTDAYGQGGYGQADPNATQGGRPGRGGRSSNKLIIGGVVAGCAAAGILVAVLMNGGENTDKSGHKTAPVAATGSTAPGTASASGSGAPVDPEVKAQAQPLSDLLGTASDSRSSVVSAVASVQKCDKLPDSQQALTAAAGKRRELQTKLGQLKTDKLPGGQQLIEQLNAAWTASAQADDEYAAWATDAQSSCDPKKPDTGNQHYKNAVQASGTATTAKKQASSLWNTIATQTGLPSRSDGDL